MRETTGNVLIR